MISFLEQKQKETEELIMSEQKRLIEIGLLLKQLKQEGEMMKYSVIIKELPEVIVASVRQKIANYDEFFKLYDEFFKLYPKMGKQMRKQNVTCATPEYCFTIDHDGEYKESDIDVEVCEAVTDFGTDTNDMSFKKIHAVEKAACIIHKGPYSTIGNAYAAVMKWIEENGYKMDGMPRESYIDGIWNKENREEWMTEIQVPIK